MPFIVTAPDFPNALDKRMAARQAHLDALAGMKAEGKVLYAAALLDDNGDMAGSMLVVDLPDVAAIETWLANEPYILHGVWDKSRITIQPCRPAALK
ncbi:MAG: YciI family protein [Alphaproteobacteria bacterium]